MKVEQLKWMEHVWQYNDSKRLPENAIPQLVLVFGCRELLSAPDRFLELRERYPLSNILCCSTSGEIIGTNVSENSLTATAIFFEKTKIKVAQTSVTKRQSSYDAGKYLADALQSNDLVHVFVISDGQFVNGSELVNGLNHSNNLEVPITGGLAGDGALFQKTLVGINEPPTTEKVVAVGFYGSHLKVGHGSRGGWDPFGPERTVTRSKHNVLFELDNQNALELYKKYLGPLAKELPGSALLFPLSINIIGSKEALVRTVLTVDEVSQSMTFAGDVPEGATVRLMKANFDRLIDAATDAAGGSLHNLDSFKPELAILISCVGRKLVLSHRVEEEVEEARKVLGENSAISGFYSYGEISPLVKSSTCELHNQTMTITTYRED